MNSSLLLAELTADAKIKTSPHRTLEELISAGAQLGFSSEVLREAGRIAADVPHDEAIAKIEELFLDAKDPETKSALKAAVRAICRTQPSTGLRKEIYVYRRNKSLVPWDTHFIEVAIRMAFISVGVPSAPAAEVAEVVAARASSLQKPVFGIEEIQDIVQEELMRLGHYKVAAHYILYRSARSASRAASPEPPVAQGGFLVLTEDDGATVLWDGLELQALIKFASRGLTLNLSPDEIERELKRSFPGSTTRADLEKLLVLNVRSLIERDADFGLFAGRMMLAFIYREVLGWDILLHGEAAIKTLHIEKFQEYLTHGVAIKRLRAEMLDFDISKIAEAFSPDADMAFDFLGIQTLYDRYLIIDKTSAKARRIETPQFFWMRVAMGLALGEKSDREEFAKKVFGLYINRRFCSSTPTLFNSGTPHSQLSSCYLYKVDDNIESIMYRGIAENAFLSKWAGGLGGSWTSVRGTGSYIAGTNGESQGVIPFLKLHNDQLVAVNQGGKRRGSGCAYLESWHSDIEDFLLLRRNTGDDRRRCHDMNTANWIPDLFMKRMEARETWTLFRSNEAPDLHELYGKAFEAKYLEYEALARQGKIYGREILALELWKQMLKMLLETGHPWITFKDPCNLRSPQDHVGVVHSSNLCTEITLNTNAEETAVCNLGSVVLDTHIKDDGSLDLAMLADTINIAVRALDNVIDINFYPTEAAKVSNSRHRPIGLGVMGLQNALFKRGGAFASQAAVEFNDEFMEAIALFAYTASCNLAREKGRYESYSGSKWDRGLLPQDTIDILESERGVKVNVPRGGKLDWTPLREQIKAYGMRNSNVLAIAPTATISNIMGTTPCIEPNYKNLYAKENLGGKFTILNTELVRDLEAIGLWNLDTLNNLKIAQGELTSIPNIPASIKQKHLTVFDVPFEFVIDAAARRQKWIDQAQSVNLFIREPDLKVLSHMYRRAWHGGMKTTYYLRSLGASSIEGPTSTVKKDLRGVVAGKPEFSEAEKMACSLEAMRNGGECEACQ